MAKEQEIGAYSAYAIAVKHGYEGTEEEWVAEQEKNRKASEKAAFDANNAKETAENAKDEAESAKSAAAGSATSAATSAAQAAQSASGAEGAKMVAQAAQEAAENAKDDAESAKSAAAVSASLAQTSAAQAAGSAESADSAKTAAAQSAENAATSEANVAQAEERINTAVSGAVEAVTAQETKSVQAVAAQEQTSTAAVTAEGERVLGTIPADYTVAVGEIDTLKKSKAEIDDTAIDGDTWSSKHIVDMLCPKVEKTGTPVQMDGLVEGYPLGVKVSWEPTQEGSGDPSPENIRPISGRDSVTVERCGENLLDISPENIESGIYQNGEKADGLLNSKQQRILRPIAISPGQYIIFTTFYTLNLNVRATFLTHNGNYLSDISLIYNHPTKVPENACFMLLHSSTEGFSGTNPMITIGSTAPTAYTPYTGQTAALTLPHTIYGGTVNAVTSEGQETWKLVTLDGTEAWTVEGKYLDDKSDWYYTTRKIQGAINASPTKGNDVCSHYPHADVANNNNVKGLAIVWQCIRARWGDTTPDNADDWKAYLAAQYAAGTPVQVCYKLAEPEPFTATGGAAIPALSGTNTVLTDADDMTVTGRADPIQTISKLSDRIAALEAAATNIDE